MAVAIFTVREFVQSSPSWTFNSDTGIAPLFTRKFLEYLRHIPHLSKRAGKCHGVSKLSVFSRSFKFTRFSPIFPFLLFYHLFLLISPSHSRSRAEPCATNSNGIRNFSICCYFFLVFPLSVFSLLVSALSVTQRGENYPVNSHVRSPVHRCFGVELFFFFLLFALFCFFFMFLFLNAEKEEKQRKVNAEIKQRQKSKFK